MTAQEQPIVIVSLTESAIKQAYRLYKKEEPDSKRALRFAVKGGGCSGLSYDLKFDEVNEKDYKQFAEVPVRKSYCQ